MELALSIPPDLKIARDAAEQFLRAVPLSAEAVSFELLGTASTVQPLLACGSQDRHAIAQALKAYFPEVLISAETECLTKGWTNTGEGESVVAAFGLGREFMVPLRTIRTLDVDPLAGVVEILGSLEEGEVALFQVLFQHVRNPWAREAIRAVLDPDGSPFFIDAPEVSVQARAKVSSPLLAASVRIGVKTHSPMRSLGVARQLTGALAVLADPLGNELIPLHDGDSYQPADHEADLLARRTRRSGMLLSVEELTSLVHLPSSSVRSPKLIRHGRRTKRAPEIATGRAFTLGRNTHDGRSSEVSLSPDQRSRHCYLIGASGTGKSTLMLQMIAQDLKAGEGVAVLDPHGDLIDQVLNRLPEERLDDVILIDPADAEYPTGFNILSAHSELERTLLASDLVTVFQRLSLSWGDQMTSVLANAILAFLESDPGGTLVDLRRFLIEPAFRREILATVRDPDIVYFWEREFTLLRGKPQAPILTRLDTFLRPKPIRYMVAQKESPLDLRQVMDQGKVLLCRLSHGAIGEENAYLLGSLIVSKLYQLALSRQEVAERERRPFYVYIDEFHHFITPSMAQILSGARKYGLGLILAHQDLRQLQRRSSDVLSAVLTNPCTRVCFRVGDEDAPLLAKGFASFDARDLQSLGTGEAIARVERAEFDFNLETAPLSPVDGQAGRSLRDRVVERTRERYGKPRAEIEALLRLGVPEPRSQPEQLSRRDAVPSPPQPSIPRHPEPTEPIGQEPATSPPVEIPTEATLAGRGGPQHRYIQELIRRWAEAHEWRAVVEEPVLDGLGHVDVALRKGSCSVACEIVVSSPAEHEVQNLQKCLAAGFSYVAEVSTEKRRLGAVRALAKKQLPAEEFARVAFVSPEELFELLPTLESPLREKETTVRGYRVRVRQQPGEKVDQADRRSVVSGVIAKALRRIKAGK